MMQNRKNSLTIQILSKLKAKGAPEPQIQSFSPLGESESEDDEDQNSVVEDNVESKVQPTPPKRKKARDPSAF